MRRVSPRVLALLAVTAVMSPAAALAQAELTPLDRVHQLYLNGQPRDAARNLGVISAEWRQEIGRCKDPDLGAKLMEAEPRVDALVSRLGNGRVASERELRTEFAVLDQLLAENHLQLAELGWNARRSGSLVAVGHDLDLAARYAERSARWAQRTLDASDRSAIESARASAARLIEASDQAPADVERVLRALGAVVRRQSQPGP